MPKTDFKALRHVLIVENEPLMRDLLAKSVESAGFIAVSYTHLTLPTNREV